MALCAAMLLALWPGAAASAGTAAPIKVFVDTSQIQLTLDPVTDKGTTFVQFRPLFESMELEVAWDPEKKLVTGSRQGLEIQLGIGEKTATVNGTKVALGAGARVVNGNTLVPLRFVGEATGSIVYWDPANREITIVTEKLWTALGLTKEEVERRLAELRPTPSAPSDPPATTPPSDPGNPANPGNPAKPDTGKPPSQSKPVDLKHLQGMYYNIRDDFGGYECGGTCWDMYTFFPGGKVFVGTPKSGGPETIDCAKDGCTTYTISKGKLVLGNGDSYPIKVDDKGYLWINDNAMTAVEPVQSNLRLEGSYQHIGYTGLIGVNAAASSWTEYLDFAKDGTFKSTDLTIGSLGSGTSVSTDTAASSSDKGTYSISGNTITFKFGDGNVVKSLFFLHDGDPTDVQIGDRNFYIDDDDE